MKQIIIFGGLLAVSLVGTYVTWFSDEASTDDEETVAGHGTREKHSGADISVRPVHS